MRVWLILMACGSLLAQTARTPVVVELFTSEGCSSCPPADDLLIRLQKEQPVPAAEIITLGQHVDYWNQLGWRDPYSSAEFTARQQQYGRVFHGQGPYTPQMVVDGRSELVGSDARRAGAAISEASRAPKAEVHVARAQESQSGAVTLSVRVENLPKLSAGDTAEVLLAVTENNLSTKVARGENSGRKLIHGAVVRRLSVLGKLKPKDGPFSAQPSVSLDKGWKPQDLRAVVFVQERNSRRVLGAAATALAE